MAVRKYLACLCCLLLLDFVFSVERKTLDMIYKDITSFSPCVRRFNRHGQTGCSSDMNGNTGVIHYIKAQADLDWLLDKGPHEPYMPILSPQMFTYTNINLLMKSNKVNGMMVIHTNVDDQIMDENFSFSPDQSCPNQGFGYDGSCDIKWNENGTNLFAQDFNIPIFALTDENEVQSILDCYNETNKPTNEVAREYPLCAVELMDFMFGAVDTETCMRRSENPTNIEYIKYCDPLSDFNVWGTLLSTDKEQPLEPQSVIIAAAPLDSTSLFYNVTPETGAELVATSFITLLSAAYAMGRLTMEQRKKLRKNIMFDFFHGESYDYIGSSRTVFDMNRGQYPMKLDKNKKQPALMNLSNIAMFVELRQLGLPDRRTYYTHQAKDSPSSTNAFIGNLQTGFTATNVGIQRASSSQEGQGLPPASFQSFLRESSSIPGVVIADHKKQYNNRFYNSRFEVATLLGLHFTQENETDSPLTNNLNDVATGVAKALYLEAGGTDADAAYNQIQADASITGQLIYCFLYRPSCSLFQSVVDKEDSAALSEIPYQFYIGVHRSGTHSSYVSLVQKLLAYFIALDISSNTTEENCVNEEGSELYDYSYMQGPNMTGICVQSATGLAIALSPAFIDDGNVSPDWSSDKYSTWTESAWSKYTARLFLKPSRQTESLIFSIGMINILLSFLLIYFLNAKGATIFSRE